MIPRVRVFLMALLALSLSPRAARAQSSGADRGATIAVVPVNPDRRLALVVGNSAYPGRHRLPNPVLDADAMSRVLGDQGLGFEVTKLTDANRESMAKGFEEFQSRLPGAHTALVYFAGHGVQLEGQNYLVPIDVDLGREGSVRYNAIKLQEVLDGLEGKGVKLKVVILDACRNNPFERVRGGGTGGLAPAVADRKPEGEGMLIAYATSPGHVALDGEEGRNGLYTAHLLEALRSQATGAPIEEVFKLTRKGVVETSRGKQIPWETSALMGTPTLKPGKPGPGSLAGEDVVATNLSQTDGKTRSPQPAVEAASQEATKKAMRAAMLAAVQNRKPFPSFPRCPEMVVVPAGSFLMGSPGNEEGRAAGEGPQRRITVEHGFAVSSREVTFDEWDECVLDGGCNRWPNDHGWGRGKRPVIDVSWEDAQQYVGWLNRKIGIEKKNKGQAEVATENAMEFRLLSEAEWEYMSRAGTIAARYWGDSLGQGKAHCLECGSSASGDGTLETATFKGNPNPWGLYDTLGNVWEWVGDCRPATMTLESTPADAARNETGDCSWRAIRGGSWTTAAKGVRAAARAFLPVGRREGNVGFRVAFGLDHDRQ